VSRREKKGRNPVSFYIGGKQLSSRKTRRGKENHKGESTAQFFTTKGRLTSYTGGRDNSGERGEHPGLKSTRKKDLRGGPRWRRILFVYY